MSGVKITKILQFADRIGYIQGKMPGKTTIDVLRWLAESGPKHFGTTARFLAVAVRRLDSVRRAGEPADVDWMLAHLDELVKRFAVERQPEPATLRAYAQRARVALESFLEWSAAPATWMPTRRRRAATSPTVIYPPASLTALGAVPASLDDELREALVAIARWPRLQPYLLPALTKAMEQLKPASGGGGQD